MSNLNKNGIKKLVDFYKERMTSDFVDEESLVTAAEIEMSTCGKSNFEMPYWETKSKITECVYFEPEDFEPEDFEDE